MQWEELTAPEFAKAVRETDEVIPVLDAEFFRREAQLRKGK
jgi:hypothetical protein